MSEENVEIVRRLYEAVARRDDVFPFEVYADDIVWDVSDVGFSQFMTRPVFHGHEGVRQFWREMVASFKVWDFEVEKIEDAGDHVLAVVRDQAVGRASGAPVEASHVAVWTMSGGRVIRMQACESRRAALQAAGLSK
jgi:ketosteroid isomerase-like protein